MGLVRLVYYSRNRLDTAQGALAERVSDILVKSVANNRKVDISGGLIFSKEWFAQVLEGDRVAVTETYARIERDPRHGEVMRCEVTPIEKRRFSYWWMAAAGWSEATAAIFRRYSGGEQFDPRAMSAEGLCDLIAAVLDYQMHHLDTSTAPRWLSAWRDPDAARNAQAATPDSSAA